MVGYVGVVVTVGWLVVMIGDLGRECGGWDDEEGGSFPGYGWCGLWWWSEALFEGDAMCVCVLGMLGIGNS